MILHQKKKKKKKKKVHVHQQFQSRHCLFSSFTTSPLLHSFGPPYLLTPGFTPRPKSPSTKTHLTIVLTRKVIFIHAVSLSQQKCAGVHFLRLSGTLTHIGRRVLSSLICVNDAVWVWVLYQLMTITVDNEAVSAVSYSSILSIYEASYLYTCICTIILTNVYTFLSLFTDTDVYTHVTFL